MNFQIIGHDLMLEEHFLVTPFGSGKLSVKLKRADECFNTTKRKRLVGGQEQPGRKYGDQSRGQPSN